MGDQKLPGVFLPAKLGGWPINFLVDTGAQVSIVPKAVWLEITKGSAELRGFEGKVAAANGEEMEVIGRWQTTCQFDSLAVVAEFLVVEIPSQEVLLGTDFLARFGAVIDLGGKCCRLMGKKLPLLLPGDSELPLLVTVHADTIVPPRSEIIIQGATGGSLDKVVEGMLEPSTALPEHCDVLVARVACTVNQGLMPVRVLNVTDEACILKKGMSIGKLFTDVVIDSEPAPTEGDTPVKWDGDTLREYFGLETSGFDPGEMRSVSALLHRHASVFSTGDTDLGRTHVTRHQINTSGAKPIKIAPRRIPLHLQQEASDHVKQMLDNNIIRPSCSPWASPVVLVRKKDGTLRFCVDDRGLNDVTEKDAYPLPRIDDALDSLNQAQWFSTLDLASGYWQVEVDPIDRPKTAFSTRQGLFEFNVLSFGLCNAPSTFQRLMDVVLADSQWTSCLVYLDDIIVFGRSFQEHLIRLDEVLSKLSRANLKVKPAKCNLFASQVQYLGHIISAKGVMADPAKIEAVRSWPTPKNQTEVRSFVGLASYYRRFVKGFAEIARPLHQLTEKGRRFKWEENCQRAFNQLKAGLISSPVLSYPDPHHTFILDTDASNVGIGAVLSQEVDGLEQVIAYASRALTKQERKYATTKKELLGMVTFTKYFKHYLLGKEFILRTDHNSLRWLHNFKGLEGQLARWVEQLANFHYKIVHRPGKQHGNADALSRLPAFHEELVANPSPPVVAVVRQVGQLVEADWNIVDDLAQAQQEDAEIKLLIELKKRNGGSGAELQSNRAVRKYAPVWDQLQVQGQRLVRIPPVNSDAAHQVQVVLPKSLVPKVLAMLHSAKTGGHLGVQKLQGKVKDRFYWMGWFSDVKQWCRECVDCASRKTQGRARGHS
ncbi:hypothetical protein DPEC_G00006050 [Dallia pectoralis]|uniref:Uncharacterized protein n=1 Tax=Dallia pectoralis TaxID=75939 RepID=A0ACC2HLH3_DALPE|nr:hypothetical protein DPEC_G00006050 [Dallia pectoralis]